MCLLLNWQRTRAYKFGLWSVLNLYNLLFLHLILYMFTLNTGVFGSILLSVHFTTWKMCHDLKFLHCNRFFIANHYHWLRNKAINLFHQPRPSTPSHGETIWDLLGFYYVVLDRPTHIEISALYSIYVSC